MKSKLLALLALCALPAFADVTTNVVLTTAFEDGSTNTWTQADLVDALGLMNRKYHRDMETESGRVSWHGRRLQQYAMTNSVGLLQIVTVYTDGYAHTAEAKPVAAPDPEAALKAKAKAEAILAAWEAANLPAEIAALRAAQREASRTNTVTVVVSPTAP